MIDDVQLKIAILLDISKAYDKVWLDGLMIKLWRNNIRGRTWNWIDQFVHNRKIRVVEGSEWSEGSENGSAQQQHNTQSTTLDDDCIEQLYADDIMVHPRKHGCHQVGVLQRRLEWYSTWADMWCITFSVTNLNVIVGVVRSS